MSRHHLSETPLLDFGDPGLSEIVTSRGWRDLRPMERIGAAYDFVRNEIRFGYNSDDNLAASKVLRDGYGQCNTKGTLLMALLRALGIPCRFHAFTINRRLQRGIIPEIVYPLTPQDIIHSWVEIELDEGWINLEGYILDQDVLDALQARFPNRASLCAYGAGTNDLHNPGVEWNGRSTFIQKTAINRDLGTFDCPDHFYANHGQLSGTRGLLFRSFVRHWMNQRVERLRNGHFPMIPGGDEQLGPAPNASVIMEVA